MNINRSNYEVFFLDYIEGNLSPEQVQELHIFLALNPDLDEELRGLDQSVLSYSDEVFEQKELLKRPELPISQEDLDEMLIQEFDGLASAGVLAKLDELCAQYSSVAAQRVAMNKARFIPGEESFEFKSHLRFDSTPDLTQTDMLLAGASEGDLNVSEQAELNERIKADQRLANSQEVMNRARIAPDAASFERKSDVQIPDAIDFSDIRYLLIAKVEGDLTGEQNERLSAALASDASLRMELQRYYQARLVPESMAYEHKNDLRKKETTVIPLRRVLSVAASLAAVLALIYWFGFNEPASVGEVAGKYEPGAGMNQPKGQDQQKNNDETESVSGDKLNTPVIRQENHLAQDEMAYQEEMPSQVSEDQPRNSVPLPFMKTLHAPENAFAHIKRMEAVLSGPDMSLIHADEQNVAALEQQIPNETREPATIWQLLGEAAEERLEKTAAFALVERQVEKVTPQNPEKFKLERVDKEDKSQLHMKLGKFEFSRDTKKRPESKGRLERIIDRFVKE